MIKRMRVTLEPMVWKADNSDGHIHTLRVEVDSGRRKSTTTLSIELDFFESHFDYIFEKAKRAIRAELEKEGVK